ncbi:MAG: hypothetical protein P8Y95_05335 [Gammaproteobacteria bacterium]|jgi:hypothetical protein
MSRTRVFRLLEGAIHEVSLEDWVRFVDGRTPLPSGRTGELRVVFLTIETTEAGLPRFCQGIEGAIYALDSDGFVQKGRMFPVIAERLQDASGRVVDARHRFLLKQARSRYRWVPDRTLCERLLAKVLGASSQGTETS